MMSRNAFGSSKPLEILQNGQQLQEAMGANDGEAAPENVPHEQDHLPWKSYQFPTQTPQDVEQLLDGGAAVWQGRMTRRSAVMIVIKSLCKTPAGRGTTAESDGRQRRRGRGAARVAVPAGQCRRRRRAQWGKRCDAAARRADILLRHQASAAFAWLHLGLF